MNSSHTGVTAYQETVTDSQTYLQPTLMYVPREIAGVGENGAAVREYTETHCWQYDIRVHNLAADLKRAKLSLEEAQALEVKDFRFEIVTESAQKRQLSRFIQRHEWLGNLSQYTTHWFACYYRQHLAGVQLFNMPNAFSKLLGDNTPHLERLISRGACISWTPKNLASNFLMWSIRWMVKNTEYRLFTAYADPEARELGTIYQACNFYYLGKGAGAAARYINPYTGRVVSDRYFRQRTAYKKYAEELGIAWQRRWETPTGMNWEVVPENVAVQLREFSRMKQETSVRVPVPQKHKYAYILGASKAETKSLRKLFEQSAKLHSYPKERGE
jgi:hypothetical protein